MIDVNKKMKKIILLGAPGSGKGTLSEYLVSKYNFVHLSTGDLFRKNMDQNNSIADELRKYVPKGELVPDDLTNKVVKKEILELNSQKKSFILDGYPRTIDQANFLNNIATIDASVYLNVDLDIIIKRLTGRRTCSVCKKIYNINSSETSPKIKGVCDLDNGLLMQRKDDEESVINQRMQVYKKTTFPLIEFYRKNNKLYEIDGNMSKIETEKAIDKIIESF